MRLFWYRLGPQEQSRGGKLRIEDGRDPNLWPDSASRASNPLREAHEILLAGARLEKRSREQRDIRQEVGRQYVQVKTEVEIQHAVGVPDRDRAPGYRPRASLRSE